MREAARTKALREVLLGAAVVRRRDGDEFLLVTEVDGLRATRATACLVEPRPDDEVIYASIGDRYVILSVIARSDEVTTLSVDGDLRIDVPRGGFQLAAREEISLASAVGTSVVAPKIGMRTNDMTIFSRAVSVLGDFADVDLGRVRVLADRMDSVIGRWMQRAKHVYRFIEGRDHTEAETIDHRARSTASVHGENATVTAQRVVKVDGEQIHVG